MPYTSGTTRKASVNYPATFTDLDTAASATGYDGIGIRAHGRIVGIGLDNCIEEGNLLPWAQTIADHFDATYIKVSPSGTGIRIFCLLPDGFTYDTGVYYIKKGDIEVKELNAQIIRALVERIDVFTPEKVPGTRMKKQTTLIHWNFIGAVELPQEQKKSA